MSSFRSFCRPSVARWFVFAVAAILLECGVARATVFNESEGASGNNNKTNANVVNFDMVAGDAISGTTTGTSTTGNGLTTIDYFRLRTATLSPGIYFHRLTITTSGTAGHTGALRGLTQTNGAINAGTDVAVESSSTVTTPPRSNGWYGFGKREELYYSISGGTNTTQPYVSTLSTTAITPSVIGPFVSGLITISTEDVTTQDTEVLVFNSNFDPILTFNNDDTYVGPNTRSTLKRVFAPGTYYVAVTTSNSCTNEAAAIDDDGRSENVMDFADSFVRASTATVAVNLNFTVTDSSGTASVTNQLPAGVDGTGESSSYRINWYSFTVNAAVSAPSNDECAGAIALINQDYTQGTTFLATNSTTATCDTNPASRDVWYKFTEAHSGALTVETCGVSTSTVDTTLALFSGSCGSLTQVACNDNCGGACGGTNSCISASVTPGTYYIRVSDKGLGANGGMFNIHPTFVPNADTPCGAAAFTAPFADTIDNSTCGPVATNTAVTNCTTTVNQNGRFDVWYTTTPVDDCVLAIAENSSQDVAIVVWVGDSCNTLSFSSTCIASSTTQSLVLGMSAGTQYWIQFASRSTSATFAPMPSVPLDVSFACVPPPTNDVCSGATPITTGQTYVVSNASATHDTYTNCGGTLASARFGVWFSYSPMADCVLQMTETSAQDIAMTVFQGPTCNNRTTILCDTNENTTVGLTGGQNYWILVNQQSATAGPPAIAISITFDCLAPLANDACSGAIDVSTLTFPVSIEGRRAGHDRDVDCNSTSATNVWNGVWYTYIPTMNCALGLSETTTQNNAVFGVFTGPDCNSLTPYFCMDNGTTDSGEFVDVYAGTKYWILLGLSSASPPTIPTTNYSFNMTCATPIAGDACTTAFDLTSQSLPYSTNIDNSAFTASAPGGMCDTTSPSPTAMRNDVWHKYTASTACTGQVIVDPPASYDAIVQVWEGPTCASLTFVTCSNANAAVNSPDYVNFSMVPGHTYWIQFGKSTSVAGGGSTFFSFDCQPPPANDLPCNATVLTALPFSDSVNVSTATHDPWMYDGLNNSGVNFCGTIEPQQTWFGIWYTYTPTSNCTMVIEDTSPLDVSMGVFVGGCGGLQKIACTGGSAPFTVMSYPLSGGQQYYFLIGVYTFHVQPDPNNLILSLNFDCRQPPANDLPCNATDLNQTGLPYNDVVDTEAATNDERMSGTCLPSSAAQTENGVWYAYTPAADCTLTVFETSNVNVAIAIYDGFDCQALSERVCTGNEQLSFGLTGGTRYWVLLAPGHISPGLVIPDQMNVTIDCSNAPANDLQCGAIPITSTPYSRTQSITLATNDPSTTCSAMQKAVWWTYMPTSDCMALINETSTLDVGIGIYLGVPDCTAIGEIDCTTVDHFAFPMQGGQRYFISIGLQSATPTVPTAQLAMTFDCVPNAPPANDECSGATVIGSLPFTDHPVNATATHDRDVSCNDSAVNSTFYGVWYQYTPTSNCSLLFAESTIQNVVWGVFTGPDCNSLTEVFCTGTDSASTAANLFAATANTTYWILVGMDATSTHTIPQRPGVPLSILIDCVNVPANDTCVGATTINSLPFTTSYNPFLATDGLPAGSCNSPSATSSDNDVWFRWTAPGNCDLTIDLQYTSEQYTYGPISVIYEGSDCNNLTEVACHYTSGVTHQLPYGFHAVAGHNYWFQNARRFLSSGSFLGPTTFSITGSCTAGCPTCPGDLDANSMLSGGDIQSFLQCVIAAAGGPPTGGCECADIAGDANVTQQDVDAFVLLLLSPPSCP